MKRLSAAFLFASSSCLVAQATVQATFTRLDVDLRSIVGRRVPRGAGIMTVMLCTDNSSPVQFPRERVLQSVPAVHALPNVLALDLGARAVAQDPRSFIGTNGQALLNLASAGLTAGGIAIRSDGLGWAGLGISIIGFIISSLAKQSPSIAPYIGSLLPDQIALSASGCGTWGIVASRAPADTIVSTISVPKAPGIIQ